MGLFSFTFAWTGASSFHPVRYIGEEMDKMPMKPKKPCRHPGCPNLTDGIYCEEHRALHCSDWTSSAGRGYDRRWRIARSRFLKTHPLCVRCREQGRLVRQLWWIILCRTVEMTDCFGMKRTGRLCVRTAMTARP